MCMEMSGCYTICQYLCPCLYSQYLSFSLSLLLTDADSPCPNGDVRLVGGNEYSGRVEICLGGVWGSLCRSFSWQDNTAQVICRMIGYNNSEGK